MLRQRKVYAPDCWFKFETFEASVENKIHLKKGRQHEGWQFLMFKSQLFLSFDDVEVHQV